MSDTIKPAAWINVEKRKLEWAKPVIWDTPTVVVLKKVPLYTADALAAAREEALDEAAKFCDDLYERSASRDDGDDLFENGIKWATDIIAEKIRVLKEKRDDQ